MAVQFVRVLTVALNRGKTHDGKREAVGVGS